MAPSAAPAQRVRAEPPAPPTDSPPASLSAADAVPDGPNIGLELLARLPALSTPPTLGRLGGLPAMAQTLPTVERFLQKLPSPPVQPLLPGLSEPGRFAASLPSVAAFSGAATTTGQPAFPAQLDAPSEPTDVLAPPGGMPGQLAGLSGEAPVLAPTREPPTPPLVVPLPAAPAATPTGPAVQRALPPIVGPGASNIMPSTPPGAAQLPPAAPALVPPGIELLTSRERAGAPMTQVLPPELTLTGNVLAGPGFAPIQREVLRAAEEDWATPAEFVQRGEEGAERVSADQRQAIESLRGQGSPLPPETRERFEQAFGQTLDEVRVHTGAAAHATAESLNAIAFASGPDLFFTQNAFAPESAEGLSLIGHELAHVIQQQYGVTGDADALRPPDDRYEQQADQLATQALQAPLPLQARVNQSPFAQPAEPSTVQRAHEDELQKRGSGPTVPAASAWTPSAQLGTAGGPAAPEQPLATALPQARKLPEDEPVQRFTAANGGSPATIGPAAPEAGARQRLQAARERIGGLTDELPSSAGILSSWVGLSQHLPGLGEVSQAGRGLPAFRAISRGLPGLGSFPDLSRGMPSFSPPSLPDTGALAHQIPGAGDIPQSLPSLPDVGGAMPDLGGLAQGLGAGLPPMPGELPALGGLTPPEMPLAQGLGAAEAAAGQAASGALAAGQQALGSITSMAPSGADVPAAPPLPSLDKLTEHIWKEVQRKLKVERERSRGLA